MSLHANPGDGPALMRALHQHHVGQLQEAAEARRRHRLVAAAGIEAEGLSAQAQRILVWLSGWDDPTIDGVVEIVLAARAAAEVAAHREVIDSKVAALRDAEAATEAALVRFDEQEAQRDERR
jgi:hypothetical protein